jgi:protein-disulfide isomerase
LRHKYPEECSVVWRHFPDEDSGVLAARAAVCAAEQGVFESVNKALFEALGADASHPPCWVCIASQGGVGDTAKFRECLASTRSLAAVRMDVEAARRLRVVATPTILINGYLYAGLPSDLIRIVRREVKLHSLVDRQKSR